jgi:hypothetical protein
VFFSQFFLETIWIHLYLSTVEVQRHAFLIAASEGGEWSASRTGDFIPRERTPDAHWIGGWLGPRAGLNAVEREKFPSPHRESNTNPDHPARSQSLYRLSYLSSRTFVRHVLYLYVIAQLLNALCSTVHKFPDHIRIKCFPLALNHFLPWRMPISGAISSMLILRCSGYADQFVS